MKRIAITGSLGTGKSTLAKELSRRTGRPLDHARQMREILPEMFPGKQLMECSPWQIFQMFTARMSERAMSVAGMPCELVSDGCALNDWAFLYARCFSDPHGKGKLIAEVGYREAVENLLPSIRRALKQQYSHMVLCGIDFGIVADGQRPTSEKFRKIANDLIVKELATLDVHTVTVNGDIEGRLKLCQAGLGIHLSKTYTALLCNCPSDEGQLMNYDQIDDILGEKSSRFFSNGFRKVNHHLRNVEVNKVGKYISGVIDIEARDDWSIRKTGQEPYHVTNIDALLIAGQFAQVLMFAMDGIRRGENGNMWVRHVELATINKVESLSGIDFHMRCEDSKIITKDGERWHLATLSCEMAGGKIKMINYKVCYQLKPQANKELCIANE